MANLGVCDADIPHGPKRVVVDREQSVTPPPTERHHLERLPIVETLDFDELTDEKLGQ